MTTLDDSPCPYNRTDYGNAERLAAWHGQDLRYCHPWGKWLAWDGRRWAPDATAEVMRRAKLTARMILGEAAGIDDDKDRRDLVHFALRTERAANLRAMVTLAESEPGIPVLPEELDRDPWLLTCLNGTIDLKSGDLREHRREDLVTKLAPVEYDPTAQCPAFLTFLRHIMAASDPLIEFLQRAVGYSLTGQTSERVIFLLYGTGANGKTTFLELLRKLLGDYALRTPTSTLLVKPDGGIPNDLARLKGARFVSASETEQGKRLAEALVKDVTGGDTISARFLGREYFDFRPECKIWLATNHRPVIRGTDKAIWDRIRLIPFTVTIPEGERDPGLLDKLSAELPGVLAWAVRGCLDWRREGLGTPPEVRAATEGYRNEMDLLAGFLEDCCFVDPQAQATAKLLYSAYTKWCEDAGERAESQRSFGLRLAERGFQPDKGTGGRRVWRGLGLLDPNDRGRVAEVADSGTDSHITQTKIKISSNDIGNCATIRHLRHLPLEVPPNGDVCVLCGAEPYRYDADGQAFCEQCAGARLGGG